MAKHLRDFYKETQNTICVVYILKGPTLNLLDGVPKGNFKGREVQNLNYLETGVLAKPLY